MCRIRQIFDNYFPLSKVKGDILFSARIPGVGIGIGVTDLYPPHFLSQWMEITRLAWIHRWNKPKS